MREIARSARARGKRIAFVPTMGCLHEGHLTLIRTAKELADIVVVSIFVNPTQFGPGEDFEKYPRNLTRDADLCIAEGVEYLFMPQAQEIYPPGPRTFVQVEGLSTRLEGSSRPGHFRGVATVVTKLFEILRPDIAVFGRKDAQQAIVIRRLVVDLMMETEIFIAPTVRDDDGLALSSRNNYLAKNERKAAVAVPRSLDAVEAAVAGGEREIEALQFRARQVIEAEPLLKVDYAEIVDAETLEPLTTLKTKALLVVAVHVGSIRLLDNLMLEVPEEPDPAGKSG